jgi:hypothetical protein
LWRPASHRRRTRRLDLGHGNLVGLALARLKDLLGGFVVDGVEHNLRHRKQHAEAVGDLQNPSKVTNSSLFKILIQIYKIISNNFNFLCDKLNHKKYDKF